MSSAVAFSYGLCLFSMGIGDDGHQQMLEEAAEAAGGDILVHAEGYWESKSSDLVMTDTDRLLSTVEGVEGVRAAIPRMIINGLVSSANGNRVLFLQGIDPVRERVLHDHSEDLQAGEFLDETERDDPIILGAIVVEKLELELGDRVVLTATQPDGEVTRALFHLTGVIETGLKDIDEVMGVTSLSAAQEALGAEGMLTQIGVMTREGVPSDSVASLIEASVRAQGNGLEVLTWQEAIPDMVGFIEVDDAFLYIYLVVILAIVAFAIANTFLMAVMERVREFGLLNALGLRGTGVAGLLLAETLLMTALAMSIGLVLGLAGHMAASHWGIPVAAWGVDSMEVSGVDFASLVMRSKIIPAKWVAASILVALVTVGSALYPAWRASRLAPSEAMRFFG
ncbi:MAG: FtsX-like permease family protein [Gemmatimonadota bacterium]|jgi:ABC-type lipoprotein release transport system permease subunit